MATNASIHHFSLLTAQTQNSRLMPVETDFCRSARSSTDALIHYDPMKALIMRRDASSYDVRSALLHQKPSGEENLSFSPRAKCLSPRTIINSLTRKLLESCFGLNGSVWLLGLPFEIRTTHVALRAIG